jgi:hypothetical protein
MPFPRFRIGRSDTLEAWERARNEGYASGAHEAEWQSERRLPSVQACTDSNVDARRDSVSAILDFEARISEVPIASSAAGTVPCSGPPAIAPVSH